MRSACRVMGLCGLVLKLGFGLTSRTSRLFRVAVRLSGGEVALDIRIKPRLRFLPCSLFLALAAAYVELDRRALESKALADLVHEIALVRKVQLRHLVGKYDEGRRADRRLGDVEDLAVLKFERLDKAIQ